MTGLSDFSGWKPEWRDTIFVRMAQNPQQDYLFLIMGEEQMIQQMPSANEIISAGGRLLR